MKNKINISVLLITLVVTIFSCSKARIEKPIDDIVKTPTSEDGDTELIKFIPLDDYFNEKINKAELFNFTFSLNNTPLYPTTSANTIFANTKNSFENSTTGNAVDYPYLISINNFFSIKDFIFTNLEPMYNNNLLSIGGLFYITISKDNMLLSITDGAHCTLSFTNYSNFSNDTIFLYKENNGWVKTNDKFVHDYDNIDGQLSILGRILVAKATNFTTSNYTKLQYTSSKYDLTNVGIYVVFSDKNSFTRVQNLESIDLPVGEQAKLVAFGITNQGQLYSYFNDITIVEQGEYEIFLAPISDANLTNLLDQL